MYISPIDVESALLRIFSELKIPPGGTISHTYLVKRWRENRLRHSDLDLTLGRLIRSRMMQPMDTPDGRAFALTPQGIARAQTLQQGRMMGLLQRLRLSATQVLRISGGGDTEERQRRLLDRHAPRL